MRTGAAARLAAPLASVLLFAGCPRHEPPAPALAAVPEIRVGLAVGRDTVVLGGDGELLLTDHRGTPLGSIPAGTRWRAVPDTSSLRLLRPDGTSTARLTRVSAVNVDERRFAMLNGRRYRGRLAVFRDRAGLTAVNTVPVESYIAGVLGPEIGGRTADEREAVLAQAIVSRTFALRNRGRWESLGFDAHGDVRDQVYLGVAGETPDLWDAVRGTMGRVLRYQGQLIEAFFHSTCGYRTAAVEEAFATATPRPYLRAVSDARGGGGYYCERSPRFRWREEWDGPELRAILSRTLPNVVNLEGGGLPRITDVAVSRTSHSGRVGELRIVFPRGDARVPGPRVREVLRASGGGLLNSAAFQISASRVDGEVTHLVAAGAGSGHGVGMCQWGAIGRARAGQDHRRILATYYPGTTIDRIY